MSRTKRMEKERKTVFAARVITEYGDYISAQDAWRERVDKRGAGIKCGGISKATLVMQYAWAYCLRSEVRT